MARIPGRSSSTRTWVTAAPRDATGPGTSPHCATTSPTQPDSIIRIDELAANLHFRDVLRLGATVSDDAGASNASGWTAEIELRQSLGDRYQLSGSLGHYEFERNDWSDYLYWDVGVSATAGRFTFDLRYFDTDSDEAGFAGPELTRGRLVGSVSLGF